MSLVQSTYTWFHKWMGTSQWHDMLGALDFYNFPNDCLFSHARKMNRDEGRGGKMLCTFARKYFFRIFPIFLSWSNWFVDVDPSGLKKRSLVSLFPAEGMEKEEWKQFRIFDFNFHSDRAHERHAIPIHKWEPGIHGLSFMAFSNSGLSRKPLSLTT